MPQAATFSRPLNVLAAVFILSFAGCDRGPKTHEIAGRVVFQGTPISEGDVFFVQEGSGTQFAGKIRDGRYSLSVGEGTHAVKIRASKKMPLPAGKKGAMGETEADQDFIPEQYNAKTTLKESVVGPREINFDLK
jgi:hypothetical protein